MDGRGQLDHGAQEVQGRMITVHSGWADDFSSLGLCPLAPEECTVEEQAGGIFQLKMTHPMDKTGKWWHLSKWNIIKAPAPMRETPLFNMSTAEESITREIYRVKVNSRLRLRTKPSTSTGKIIGRYKNGTKVIRIGTSGNWYQVVIKDGGATGWMYSDYLEYVGTETQAPAQSDNPPVLVQPRQTREQLFRIMSVDKDDAAQQVYVTAQHVFFDLAGNIVSGKYSPEDAQASDVVQNAFAKTIKPHNFQVYSNAEGAVSGDYGGRNIVSVLTETDGILQQANARLVRDNFDVFVLEDEQRDRGVEIRHGKNMLGAVLTEDVSEVITSVVPVGKDADGEPLYLSGQTYVDAPNAEEIPTPRVMEISYDVKSGSDEFPDDDSARAELKRLAEAEFAENGINHGTVGLDVDFVALENTRQYAQYAALQSVHLYDTVRVISARSGIDARARVTGYVYNCLTNRYDSVTLGELFELQTTVSGYDITPGSVSGNRLVAGSVDGNVALRDISVGYAKITQAAIKQLNAEAITAITARFGEIAAGYITTDELYAAIAKIMALEVGSITAENIDTDSLAAVLGEFVKIYAEYAGLDFATIKDLTADEFIFRLGVAGEVYIDRLAVTSANIIAAVLGEMVLKGDDGKYYRLHIQADGTISTELVDVTEDEIQAGTTSGGQTIVETTMNVKDLNAQTIKGASAIITEIFTDALTAGTITAGQAMIASATIPELSAAAISAIGESLDLSANRTIQLLIQTDEALKAWFTFSEEGLRTGRTGSTYATLTNDVGFHILQNNEKIGTFARRELHTEAVRIGAVSASAPRVVLREAPDGGAMFTIEEAGT